MSNKATISLIIVLVAVIGLISWGVLEYQQKQSAPAPNHHNSQDDSRSSRDEAQDRDSSQKETPVTKEEAEKIVLDKFGGSVKETESDHYDGKEAWEVEVRDSSKGRIEVKVEKSTGKILSWEND